MRIKPVHACEALGISNFYFIGNPTNESEFKQMFKKVVGKDENKNAIISENPSDFGITWEQVSEKLTELQNAEPMRVLREERNRKLAQTDWRASSDLTLSNEWANYRQALRDLPSTASPSLDDNGDLTNVTWPSEPN